MAVTDVVDLSELHASRGSECAGWVARVVQRAQGEDACCVEHGPDDGGVDIDRVGVLVLPAFDDHGDGTELVGGAVHEQPGEFFFEPEVDREGEIACEFACGDGVFEDDNGGHVGACGVQVDEDDAVALGADSAERCEEFLHLLVLW